MGFNRENYKRIKEEYDGKYLRAAEAAKIRRAEVHAAIPEVEAIDRALAATGLKVFEAAMRGERAAIGEIERENAELQEKRGALLEAHGYGRDYTEIKYECDKCADTGVVDNRMCSCMRRKLIEAGFESSGMQDLIRRQRFDNFTLDYYKQNAEAHKRMKAIYDIARTYADKFDTETSGNMAFFGGTGLGKTHLSSAMAGAIIERGYDVFYTSANSMFADFEQKRFGSSAAFDASGEVSQYFACDLLIIDDLGSEIVNQFTVSCLYNVINTRLNRHKPTIISTNLSRDEFRKKYWDRIASRVFGEYLVLPFEGTDVRQLKLRGE